MARTLERNYSNKCCSDGINNFLCYLVRLTIAKITVYSVVVDE